MQPFDIQSRTRFIFGEGTISRLGELAASFRPDCVLVVSDRGIAANNFQVDALKMNGNLRRSPKHRQHRQRTNRRQRMLTVVEEHGN